MRATSPWQASSRGRTLLHATAGHAFPTPIPDFNERPKNTNFIEAWKSGNFAIYFMKKKWNWTKSCHYLTRIFFEGPQQNCETYQIPCFVGKANGSLGPCSEQEEISFATWWALQLNSSNLQCTRSCSSDKTSPPCLNENEFPMPSAQKLIAPKGSCIVQKHSFRNYFISTYTDKQMANVLPKLPVFQPPGIATQGLCQLMTLVMAVTGFRFKKKIIQNNCSYLTKPQA